MVLAMIQGSLKRRVGKTWKKKYYVLDTNGNLHQQDRKGGADKEVVAMTSSTQVGAMKDMGVEAGISITGPKHKPIFLKADSPEVADGWIRALNIMKSGGTTQNMDQAARAKGNTLRAAYAKEDALGRSGTLDRHKKGARGVRSGHEAYHEDEDEDEDENEDDYSRQPATGFPAPMASRPISFNPDLIPPPPPLEEDLEDLDDGLAGAAAADGPADDGFILRVGDRDHFVDSLGFEYYEDRASFLRGDQPLGQATLELLV